MPAYSPYSSKYFSRQSLYSPHQSHENLNEYLRSILKDSRPLSTQEQQQWCQENQFDKLYPDLSPYQEQEGNLFPIFNDKREVAAQETKYLQRFLDNMTSLIQMREEITALNVSMNQIDSTLIELKNEMMNIKNAKLNEKKAYETAINELMSMTKPPIPGKSIKLTPKEGLTNPTSRSPGSPVISFISLPRRSYDSHATQLMENKEATITGVNKITRIIQGREQTIKKYLKACQNHRENVEQIIFETYELTEKGTIDDTRRSLTQIYQRQLDDRSAFISALNTFDGTLYELYKNEKLRNLIDQYTP